MVAERDVRRVAQVWNRAEKIEGVQRMCAHHVPFLVRQASGLEQDAIGQAHITDIMKHGSPPELGQLAVLQSSQPGESHGHIDETLRLLRGFARSRRQGAAPALDESVVCPPKLVVASLQILDQPDL